MCGIVGYVGTKKARPILINGLYKLEYRGYDSAGVAVLNGNTIDCVKSKGRVADLDKMDGIEKLEGTIGIAHTRWATHGKPSIVNAHPHMDNSKHIAVVHNGIIENFLELREFLGEKGYKFLSETDTEVIPNLIDYYYSQEKEHTPSSLLEAVRKACDMLKGSYAIEVLCDEFKNMFIVSKKNSPLIIGKGRNENFVGSDIPAILSYTQDFYLINDGEYAVITKEKVDFYDKNLNSITKETKNFLMNALSIEKNGYEDFMLKEIFEQPKAISETVTAHLPVGQKCVLNELDFTKSYLQGINKIYLVACGTAMHAGLASKYTIESLSRIPVEVEAASEFRYRDPIINDKTLCVFITQSGETADTIAAAKLARERGAKTIAVSNVLESSITRETDYVLYTHAGPEIAVASTKAYTSQVALFAVFAIYLAEILEINLDKVEILKNELRSIPEKIEQVLSYADEIKKISKKFYKEHDVYFIGRGIDYATSMEASLKLKEISYIHSDAYPAGELKHGAIALIEDGKLVVSVITNPELAPKTISNIEETITRGAKTFVVTTLPNLASKFDYVIQVPEVSILTSGLLSVIPLQLFAYYISKEKGLDVDKPRNLAKSVTVE